MDQGDKVIFKDFKKNTTDTEYRDESLKAYVCATLDVYAVDFDDVVRNIKTENEKKAFIKMIHTDLEGRINRLIEETEQRPIRIAENTEK